MFSVLLHRLTEDVVKVKVPVKAAAPEGAETENDPVLEEIELLEPHSILAYLMDAGLHISAEAVQKFWRFAREFEQPWAVASPATDSHIPVGLWGDSATVFTEFGRYKIYAVFMNLPLWRPKSVRYSRFLLFTLEDSKILDYRTLLPIWRHIVWSLNCSFNGTWPSVGPMGERLARRYAVHNAGKSLCKNGSRFCCTEVRGDWAWMKETFRFPGCSWNAHKVCFRCTARSDLHTLYHHHDAESGQYWLRKEFSLVQFLNERIPATDPCAGTEFA